MPSLSNRGLVLSSGGPLVPYSNDSITFELLSATRPQASDVNSSATLRDFMMSEGLKLTMNEHYYAHTTDTRRLYHAIREITVIGRLITSTAHCHFPHTSTLRPDCTNHTLSQYSTVVLTVVRVMIAIFFIHHILLYHRKKVCKI